MWYEFGKKNEQSEKGRNQTIVCGRIVKPTLLFSSIYVRCLFCRAITFLNHTIPDFTDNGASNFIKYGNDFYATSETNYIRMIDPVTLETKDKV